jgi:hypothetical protein
VKSSIQQLSPLEQLVVMPLDAVGRAGANLNLRLQIDSTVVTVASPSGDHCALEIVFGQHEFVNQLSIFVGRGAEFCNAESFATHEEALELAEDIRQLVSSPIVGTEELHGGIIHRATYLVQFRERSPVRLTYRTPLRKVGPIERRTINYSPWLS